MKEIGRAYWRLAEEGEGPDQKQRIAEAEGAGEADDAPAMQKQSMGTERPVVTQGVDEVVEVPRDLPSLAFEKPPVGPR